MSLYSKEYMQHFQNPQNVGELKNADAQEDVYYKGEGCFDRVRIFAIREGDEIARITYLTRGCSGTIAACSAMSKMATGMTLEKAKKIQGDDIARELGGIPERKEHSVDLAVEALRTIAEKLTTLNP